MNSKFTLICAWSGLAFGAVFILGWFLIAGFLPPHLPSSTANEIAEIYINNAAQIRAGMMFCMMSTGLYAPWVAVLYLVLKRIEGDEAPIMAVTQVVSGTVGLIVFCLPPMIWAAASYRVGRDPELILLLNDMAWLILGTIVSPFIMQNLAIGIAILRDKASSPLMPRWLGFFNIWAAVIYVPAVLIPFFKSGPFAWNGVIALWIPASTFFCTVILLSIYCRKALLNKTYVSLP
ncbi:hypothetical protein [Zhongshania sp. BJYM1]|uniref:hypothetical protein n=1 Tax=Zhongshania aquatica TaxID=2965069 RepID=UPI0022B4E511|nr:hypothetical protein [Marortus sp. BJYM1]